MESKLRSLDKARTMWYADVSSFSLGMTPYSEDILEDIEDIRHSQNDNGLGRAYNIAISLEQYFGWPVFEGVKLDKDGNVHHYHSWNILDQDTILDASQDMVKIVKKEDPEWVLYRRAWTKTYNPSIKEATELKNVEWNGIMDIQEIAQMNRSLKERLRGSREEYYQNDNVYNDLIEETRIRNLKS